MHNTMNSAIGDIRLEDLPSMPQIAAKILEVLADENTTAKELNQVISRDPSLTTRILKIANSAFYGLSRDVKTLSAAIVVLGFRAIRDLVLAVSVRDLPKRFGLAEKMLWEHSVGTAIASHVTAQELRLNDREEAFILGLLHDIGKLVLNMVKGEAYSRVLQIVYNEETTFLQAEQDVLGTDHPTLGAALIRQWQLPKHQEQVVAHHHDLEGARSQDERTYRLVLLVNFADLVSHRLGFGQRAPREDIDLMDAPMVKELSLPAERIEALAGEISTAFKEECSLFGV